MWASSLALVLATSAFAVLPKTVFGIRDGDLEFDPGLDFQGGHAENRISDRENCEFLKTHDETDRYDMEKTFLEEANTTGSLWKELVPELKREETRGGKKYMVMEDVTCNVARPVIADFKLGTQSWKPTLDRSKPKDLKKILQMEKLDFGSPTNTTGVRATSIQLPPEGWDGSERIPDGQFRLAGRTAVKKEMIPEGKPYLAATNATDFAQVFKEYLPSTTLKSKFSEKIDKFIKVFKIQETYRFTGVSLFVFYSADEPKDVFMYMIDFPHTLKSTDAKSWGQDEGVLKGLETLKSLANESP